MTSRHFAEVSFNPATTKHHVRVVVRMVLISLSFQGEDFEVLPVCRQPYCIFVIARCQGTFDNSVAVIAVQCVITFLHCYVRF